MHLFRLLCSSLAVVLIALAGASSAGQTKTPAVKAAAVDPAAIEALKAMGAYMRTLQVFSVEADTVKDEVLESGQKLQFGSRVSYNVQKPNQLRVNFESDRETREMYYDGKTFTLFGPIVKYYAQVAAPPTIEALLEAVDDKYGIEIPLADLFYWGSENDDKPEFNGAIVVGPAIIGGAKCNQYAFRQEGVDWQIWIEQGPTPLPCKMVITTTSEESKPQFAALYTWNLQPKFTANDFQFMPPDGATPITLAEAEQAAVQKK